MFDSHCHLDGAATEVWARARSAGLRFALDVGIDAASSAAARARAARLEGVSWSAGLHPTEAGSLAAQWPELSRLCRLPECAAVGETGMDLYWDKATPDEQEASFRAHLALAHEIDKPVVIHCRDAFPDTYRILGDSPSVRGIMHCFSGDLRDAERALELGLHVSFAGPITYRRNGVLREVAGAIPDERLLVETDAPFLPPQSRRGQTNEPAWITETIATVAAARGVAAQEIAELTSHNAQALLRVR